MSIFFLCFSNNGYNDCGKSRLINQAQELEIFDKILSKNESDIPEFIDKHKKFISDHPQGYGLWIWKPKIIFDTLLTLKDNDILIYCDTGIHINKHGKDRLKEYLEKLKEKDMIVFHTSMKYLAQNFVKMDAIMSYYPKFLDEINVYTYAGLMVIKKTKTTEIFFKDWLDLCENYDFLNRENSKKYNESHLFIGNDCDNGLFNLCLSKNKIAFGIYPDETNIYNENGLQKIHCMKYEDYIQENWDCLKKYPFHCRRDSSRF